jgi:hypothetical protein
MRHRHWLGLGLALAGLLIGVGGHTDSPAVPVSLIQLVATPEKYDGKSIIVTGFLVMPERTIGREEPEPILYVYREDAENAILSDSLWLNPTDEMKRNKQELNGMYVTINGRFRAGPAGLGRFRALQAGGISDIKACTFHSDPKRPFNQRYQNIVPRDPPPH